MATFIYWFAFETAPMGVSFFMTTLKPISSNLFKQPILLQEPELL